MDQTESRSDRPGDHPQLPHSATTALGESAFEVKAKGTMKPSRVTAVYLMLGAFLITAPLAHPQTIQQPPAASSTVERGTVGDAPDDPGPLATDLSPALKPAAVRAAIKKVADWQLRVAEPNFNSQWTFAALYDGLIAASVATGDSRYRQAVFDYATKQQWKLVNDRFPHADDMALGQAYLELYLADPAAQRDPQRIADTKAILDRLIQRPDDPAKDLWWWCDALFMAPPVLTRMSIATNDPKYRLFMEQEWAITTKSLYDPSHHLYFRDARYLTRKEQNGQPIFWSRGNGWVMGALVKTLQTMPATDPRRPEFVQQFRDMAAEVASIQGKDGLWRSGLLDPDSYPLPEISGSAFFTYAIAYGIDEHILDRNKYLPVIQRSWAGIVSHVYADGRLGSIQPIDGQPGIFKPSASYVYGVGGFLLAGAELERLSREKRLPSNPGE
jgi:unsaturated rhamnogalacturonyl hydrolase